MEEENITIDEKAETVMKIATCTIGRMENSYVQEFVDHYKSLGVDKMFIYDNNYGKEEHFEDVIMKDISDGFVEIVDFRDKSICQLTAYQDCYNRHNSEYDWFIYCDVDEFLTLKDFGSIKDFLSQDKFNDFDMIHVNWKIYDDNDQVVRTEGGVKDRFTRVKEPLDFKKTYKLHGLLLYKGEAKKGVALLHIHDRLIIYSIKDKELGFYMAI